MQLRFLPQADSRNSRSSGRSRDSEKGLDTLKDGTTQYVSGANTLADGVTQYVAGADQLAAGANSFHHWRESVRYLQAFHS